MTPSELVGVGREETVDTMFILCYIADTTIVFWPFHLLLGSHTNTTERRLVLCVNVHPQCDSQPCITPMLCACVSIYVCVW